jgi:hypothetical protein
MNEQVSAVAGVVGLIIGILCVLTLFLQACVEEIDEDNGSILALLGAIGLGVGVFLLPRQRYGIGIFFLVVAGLAAIALFFKALAREAQRLGGGALLAMLILLGLIGGALSKWR